MKTFKKLESLGFFDWLSETHNLRDTDMKPEYLDELPLNDIHRTVGNSMVFRWFREKYKLHTEIRSYTEKYFTIIIQECKDIVRYIEYGGIDLKFNTYEKAELACLTKLIEIVEGQKD